LNQNKLSYTCHFELSHNFVHLPGIFYIYGFFLQVASLITELAAAAAAKKGFTFDEGIEERLCAYSRTVSHFPTAVKEVSFSLLFMTIYYSRLLYLM
jgi:hypothetical protein